MSHILKMAFVINDLEALDEAASEIGCELVRGQTTHKSYYASGNHCLHAIRVKDANRQTYEVGLTQAADGSYELRFDSFAGGNGLIDKIGAEAKLLRQEYTGALVARDRRRAGYNVSKVRENGKLRIHATR